jgi:uncharacterized protein
MKIIFCDSFFGKLRGLMFTRQSDRALVFRFAREKKTTLHMFFVFYPIDVVYLNSAKVIVELKPCFRPFHVYLPRNKARYVLELPAGYIEEHALAAGKKFDLTD